MIFEETKLNRNKSYKNLYELFISRSKGKSKDTRSFDHLANFTKGFAHGWYFCVPNFFKDAFDIKLTPRVEKQNKKVTNSKSSNKVMLWTQGINFNFQEGDKFYNVAYAYCPIHRSIPPCGHPEICISVENTVSLIINKLSNQIVPRNIIEFKLYIGNNHIDSKVYWQLKAFGRLPIIEFIEFLIEGPSQELVDRIINTIDPILDLHNNS